MLHLRRLQLGDLSREPDLLDEVRVTGRQRSGLGHGLGTVGLQGFGGAQARVSRHELLDEFLLAQHNSPRVSVVGALCDVAVVADHIVLVTLAQGSSQLLLNIRRPPRHINMVQGDSAGLDVRAGTQLRGVSDQHVDFAVVAVIEQLQLATVPLMDEPDAVSVHAASHQLVPDSVVDAELLAALAGHTLVAEHDLQTTGLQALLPPLVDVDVVPAVLPFIDDLVTDRVDPADARVRVHRQVRQTRVKCRRLAVVDDLQRVVDLGAFLTGRQVVLTPGKVTDGVGDRLARGKGDVDRPTGAQLGQFRGELLAAHYVHEGRAHPRQVGDVEVPA